MTTSTGSQGSILGHANPSVPIGAYGSVYMQAGYPTPHSAAGAGTPGGGASGGGGGDGGGYGALQGRPGSGVESSPGSRGALETRDSETHAIEAMGDLP